MYIIDPRKKVGVSCPFNSTISESITPYLGQIPCLQLCFNGYNDGYNNDGPILSNLLAKPTSTVERIYLHSSVRTNISNTAENSRTVVPPSIKHVNSALIYTTHIPASVILHYGSRGTTSKTIDSLYQCHIPTNAKLDYPLLLENSAGQGTELGSQVDEIRKVFEKVHLSRIGMCLDTCHAFAAGYQVDKPALLQQLLDELDNIAPKRLKMVHLNDSVQPCNSRIDRHANIRSGHIWRNDDSSLQYLLEYGAENHIDFILETPSAIDDLLNLRASYLASRQ